jgi:BolA protein
MSLYSEIEQRLYQDLDIQHMEIKDDTDQHIHHKNFDGGAHLSAVIVSSSFNGLNLLERHKRVYEALHDMIKQEIHALSMKTYTLSEWQEIQGNKDG